MTELHRMKPVEVLMYVDCFYSLSWKY